MVEQRNFQNSLLKRNIKKRENPKKGSCKYPTTEQKFFSKSVEHRLMKEYKWLLKMNLIPVGIETMSQGQFKTYLKNIGFIYKAVQIINAISFIDNNIAGINES